MSKTFKKQRDYNIDKSFRKEIDLSTKTKPSKSQYKRKSKYKPHYEDLS